MNETKRCQGCEEDKPLPEFGNTKTNPDGKQKQCRECHSTYNAVRYQRQREETLRRVNLRALAKPDEVLLGQRTSNRRRKNTLLGETYLWTSQDEHDAVQRCVERGFACYCGCGRLVDFSVHRFEMNAAHLDRIDNLQGYRPDNVEFLRAECNLLKGANTEDSTGRFYSMMMRHRINREST